MLRGLENPPLSGYSKKAVCFPLVLEIKQFSNKIKSRSKDLTDFVELSSSIPSLFKVYES